MPTGCWSILFLVERLAPPDHGRRAGPAVEGPAEGAEFGIAEQEGDLRNRDMTLAQIHEGEVAAGRFNQLLVGQAVVGEPALHRPGRQLQFVGDLVEGAITIGELGTQKPAHAIDDAGPEGPFDVVSLLIGSNNQFREHYIGEYRMEFVGLLDRAIGFASGDPSRVIVVSIPDWGVTPFGASYEPEKVAAEIDAFNAVGEEAAERAGANWVDVTAISRRTDPGLVGDKLHPSGVQYEVWVEVILPVALTALGADDVH